MNPCVQLVQEILYLDEDFQEPAGTFSGICKALDEDAAICNLVYKGDVLGLGAITGVLELQEDPTDDDVYATSEAVFTGGANGKVTGVHTEDIVIYTVCIQE